jgi:dolichol-phosphate mannosyltransferase
VTKYTFRKMLAFASESLFSFSLAPLYFGYVIGFVFLALFLLYAVYVLYVRLVLHQGIEGWSSQILITLMASAVQFLLLGILGGYVGAISREVKRRPRYVIGGRTGFGEKGSNRP